MSVDVQEQLSTATLFDLNGISPEVTAETATIGGSGTVDTPDYLKNSDTEFSNYSDINDLDIISAMGITDTNIDGIVLANNLSDLDNELAKVIAPLLLENIKNFGFSRALTMPISMKYKTNARGNSYNPTTINTTPSFYQINSDKALYIRTDVQGNQVIGTCDVAQTSPSLGYKLTQNNEEYKFYVGKRDNAETQTFDPMSLFTGIAFTSQKRTESISSNEIEEGETNVVLDVPTNKTITALNIHARASKDNISTTNAQEKYAKELEAIKQFQGFSDLKLSIGGDVYQKFGGISGEMGDQTSISFDEAFPDSNELSTTSGNEILCKARQLNMISDYLTAGNTITEDCIIELSYEIGTDLNAVMPGGNSTYVSAETITGFFDFNEGKQLVASKSYPTFNDNGNLSQNLNPKSNNQYSLSYNDTNNNINNSLTGNIEIKDNTYAVSISLNQDRRLPNRTYLSQKNNLLASSRKAKDKYPWINENPKDPNNPQESYLNENTGEMIFSTEEQAKIYLYYQLGISLLMENDQYQGEA